MTPAGEELKSDDDQLRIVPFEASIALPVWLLAGLALGAAVAGLFAGVFAAGERLFPTPGSSTSGTGISGETRRRQEIRAYLRAIDERFVEEYALGTTTVEFYLPARDVAITFDAQAYFQLEATPTFVVLCEHEMPGANLGRRLPFEVDDGTVIGNPTTNPVDAAFAALGVSRNADAATVKSAYREQVKEVHPDQGGDEEAFKELREAYTTAKNHAD